MNLHGHRTNIPASLKSGQVDLGPPSLMLEVFLPATKNMSTRTILSKSDIFRSIKNAFLSFSILLFQMHQICF